MPEDIIDNEGGSVRDGRAVSTRGVKWHAVAHARSHCKGDNMDSMDKNSDLPDCEIKQDWIWVLLLLVFRSALGGQCCWGGEQSLFPLGLDRFRLATACT